MLRADSALAMDNASEPSERTLIFCDAPAEAAASGSIVLNDQPSRPPRRRRLTFHRSPGAVALLLVLLAFGGGLSLAFFSFKNVEQTASKAATPASEFLHLPTTPSVPARSGFGVDGSAVGAHITLAQSMLDDLRLFDSRSWDFTTAEPFEFGSSVTTSAGTDESEIGRAHV
jgi:hypothetical protein